MSFIICLRTIVSLLQFLWIASLVSLAAFKGHRITSAMTFTLSSTAFENGGHIPPVYTRCDGEDLSPPLQWSGAPADTRSFALIVDDPDAPDPAKPKMTWVHWVLYNIPPSTTSLEDSVPASHLPSGTKQALNDWKTLGYGGPSPPIGTHRYFFKLYALDMVLPDLGDQATKSDVEHAMKGHIMGEAELVGRYKKAERTA